MNEYLRRESEYIEKAEIIKKLCYETAEWYNSPTIKTIKEFPAADVQEKKYCRMIPLEPDCRNYTDVFICTNCHQHIHLGFIRKEYSGNYCLECGAEVLEGDS
jgi:hypothetical protein